MLVQAVTGLKEVNVVANEPEKTNTPVARLFPGLLLITHQGNTTDLTFEPDTWISGAHDSIG